MAHTDADPRATSKTAEDPKCAHTLTQYAGDCQAPPAVDPSVGLLAHYGPRNYDDPDDVRKYAASLVCTKLASQTNRPVSTGYSKR